ncbi:MAG: hypothetical protein JRF63_15710 [Deltaproteobacteria bacterium]|nr:hypothetical protein [Deltaproteobacteria bacterium]
MKPRFTLLAATVLLISMGCGGPQPTPEAPADGAGGDSSTIAGEPAPPTEAPPPAAEAAPIGVGNKIEVSYEFGAWGPCDKQRIVYTRDGDNYSYTRICDDDLSMNAEVITAEQFRQAVFIEDYLAGAGQPLAEVPVASIPQQCDECTKCYRSQDEVLTACQNSAGVVSYMFSNPAKLGKTDSNTTRLLISYDEP